MRTYDSYKDSGIEWIGEIPRHWKVIKLKYEYKIQKGRIPKIVYDESKEGLVPYLSMDVLRGSLTSDFVSRNDGIYVFNNQLLILWDGSNSGEIISVDKEGILSSTMGVMNKIGNSFNDNYSFYLLKTYEPEIRNNTNGMGIPHVDGLFVRSLPLLLPPLSEQEQIVSYLDENTSLIDEMVEKKKRKIELLKEYRKSLINTVVTKGLNPDVPMKDSGIEWIGEIPRHWEYSKLRYYIIGVKDGTHGTHENDEDGEILLSGKNVLNDFLSITDNERKIKKEEHNKIISNGYPKRGDVLVVSIGHTLGKVCQYDLDYPISFQRSVCFIRPKKVLDSRWLFYTILSNFIQSQIKVTLNKSTIGGIYMNDLIDCSIVVLPLNEQLQIVEYLDSKTKEIDDLVQLEQKKIDFLIEYRQSLISNVVTGKIKVVSE